MNLNPRTLISRIRRGGSFSIKTRHTPESQLLIHEPGPLHPKLTHEEGGKCLEVGADVAALGAARSKQVALLRDLEEVRCRGGSRG